METEFFFIYLFADCFSQNFAQDLLKTCSKVAHCSSPMSKAMLAPLFQLQSLACARTDGLTRMQFREHGQPNRSR